MKTMRTFVVGLLALFMSLSAQAKSEIACSGSGVSVEAHLDTYRYSLKVKTPYYEHLFDSSNNCRRDERGDTIELDCSAGHTNGRSPTMGATLVLQYDESGEIAEAGMSYFFNNIFNDGPEHTGINLTCK